MILFICVLFVFCFLYALNLFLRGRIKPILEGVFSLLIIITIVSSFIIFGWKFGLLTIVLTFMFVGLSRPIAETMAFRMLGYRTGVDVDSKMERNFKSFSEGKMSFGEYFETSDKEKGKRLRKFQSFIGKLDFKDIAEKYELNPNVLDDHYIFLRTCGLHDLAWDIIRNPIDLEKLIMMRKEGKTPAEINGEFRDY